MTKTTQAVAPRPAQQVAKVPVTIATCLLSPKWKDEVQKVIPAGIMIDAMLRVARTRASDDKIAKCDPTSFLQALLKCGRAGLYPDGREAHLVAFGTEVQAIFDWKGIVALAGRAGILVTPKLVYSGDTFSVEEDDGNGKTRVTHKVNYMRARGDLVLAYSRAVLPSGQVDYEFMTADEVEETRKTYSRAKDSTPWKESWGEMAKKTVIKRHSKRWDMSPEIRQAINGDDDTFGQQPEQPKGPSKPIFKTTVEADEPKKPEPESKPAQDTEGADLESALLKLMMRDNIEEGQLVVFLRTIAMAEPDDDQLSDLDDQTKASVLAQWDEFVVKIREQSQ